MKENVAFFVIVFSFHFLILKRGLKLSAYERRPGGGGWKFVGDVDPEDGVAQQNADLEANPCPAVERQVEAGDVHQHEEDARDQEPHHIQQGAPADQHLRVE